MSSIGMSVILLGGRFGGLTYFGGQGVCYVVEEHTVELDIPNSAQFVVVARKTAEGLAARTPLTDEQIRDIILAVGEACSNAVKFSSPGTPKVRVTYRLDAQKLHIEVRNVGQRFEQIDDCPTCPPAHQLPEGGMGLYLMTQTMDSVSISCESGEIVVRMSKSYPSAT